MAHQQPFPNRDGLGQKASIVPLALGSPSSFAATLSHVVPFAPLSTLLLYPPLPPFPLLSTPTNLTPRRHHPTIPNHNLQNTTTTSSLTRQATMTTSTNDQQQQPQPFQHALTAANLARRQAELASAGTGYTSHTDPHQGKTPMQRWLDSRDEGVPAAVLAALHGVRRG